MFKEKKKKNIWQCLCLAFRSKAATFQRIGHYFHLPPLSLYNVFSSCLSQEGGGQFYSLLAITVGNIQSELKQPKHEEARFHVRADPDKALCDLKRFNARPHTMIHLQQQKQAKLELETFHVHLGMKRLSSCLPAPATLPCIFMWQKTNNWNVHL